MTDPPIPDLLFAELSVAGAACFTALFAIFAQRFAEFEDPDYRGPRFLPPVALGYAAVATAHFLAAPDYASAFAGFSPLAFVGVGFTVWSCWRLLRLAWSRPRVELVVVALGATMYLVLLINDFIIAANTSTLGEIYIRQYASLPMFLAITATLARRYFEALRRANDLASALSSEVASQREQLARSFDALREAEREQARGQERARLMGDLHDGLGLHLVTALRQARATGVPREAVASTLQDCLDDLRVAIDSLDASESDPLSLLGTLRFRMAPRFESMGLHLGWSVGSTVEPVASLDAERSLHLLRIVQEALTNALRHSGARTVTMSIARSADGLLIEVSDDGTGIDLSTVRPGRGMGQLKSRASRLGARVEWGAREGGGTAVRLTLPERVIAASPPPAPA